MLPADLPQPPRAKVVELVNEAERDRRAQVEAERIRLAHNIISWPKGTARVRAATAKSSNEELQRRRHQREAATAAHRPGAATAHLTFAEEGTKEVLQGEKAAQAISGLLQRW